MHYVISEGCRCTADMAAVRLGAGRAAKQLRVNHFEFPLECKATTRLQAQRGGFPFKLQIAYPAPPLTVEAQ